MVEQLRTNGTQKLRAIDNLSWSAVSRTRQGSVNGAVRAREKMKHHTIDNLAEAMKHFVKLSGVPPGLYKSDIDSAFR